MQLALWGFNILNTFIIFEFFRRAYGFKYENKAVNILVIVLFYFIHTAVNLYSNAEGKIHPNIISEFLLINITGFLFFHKKIGKFYFNLLFQFYLLSADLIFTCSSALSRQMLFSEMQKSDLFIPYVIANFALLIVSYRFVIKIINYDFVFLYPEAARIGMSFLLCAQLALVVDMSMQIDKEVPSQTMLKYMLVLTLVNVGSILTFLFRQQKSEDKEKKRLYEHFNTAMRYIADSEKAQKNALGRILAKHAEIRPEETERDHSRHMDYLKKEISGILYTYDCGNTSLNAIINSILAKTKTKGIAFKEKIEVTNWSFMDTTDAFLIILSLASNAIESIGGAKKMEINIIKGHRNNLIEIIHTFDPARIEKQEEKIFPAKEEIIKIRTNLATKIAEQNNGKLRCKMYENEFIVSVYLSV